MKKITLSIKDLRISAVSPTHSQKHQYEFAYNFKESEKVLMRNNPPATECLECFCLLTCRAAGTVLCDYTPVFTGPWPSQLGAQINMEKRPRLGSIMLHVMVSNDCDILCMICNWVKKKVYFLIAQYLSFTEILKFWSFFSPALWKNQPTNQPTNPLFLPHFTFSFYFRNILLGWCVHSTFILIIYRYCVIVILLWQCLCHSNITVT